MLDQLIKYFVYETKGYITKTQLVKFIYLADLYAVKWTGKPLTDLDWCYYRHGPWNESIDFALNKMDGQEVIQESQENTILIKPNLIDKLVSGKFSVRYFDKMPKSLVLKAFQ